MVTPVTDEKMDDRYSTLQLSHSVHTHWLNGGERHNGNVGIHRQKKLEGRSCESPPFTMAFSTGIQSALNPLHPHQPPPATSKRTHANSHTTSPTWCTIECHWLTGVGKRITLTSYTPFTEWLIRALQNFWQFPKCTLSVCAARCGTLASYGQTIQTSIRCTWHHIQ